MEQVIHGLMLDFMKREFRARLGAHEIREPSRIPTLRYA